MLEKQLQTKFAHWLSTTTGKEFVSKFESCAFELKTTKTNSLPFSRFAEHQLRALDLAKNNQLYYKIPDMGLSPKPFDCFVLSNANSFVVCFFNCDQRGVKDFYIIELENLQKEMQKAKSLTKIRAKEIGWINSF